MILEYILGILLLVSLSFGSWNFIQKSKCHALAHEQGVEALSKHLASIKFQVPTVCKTRVFVNKENNLFSFKFDKKEISFELQKINKK